MRLLCLFSARCFWRWFSAARSLVELLEVDRHRVSRMVKELQEADIVAVEQNPENKRENILVLHNKENL